MGKSAVITARVDEETLALVDKVAKASGRSRAWIAAQAIREMAEREAELHASIQRGLDDMEAGRVVPHEKVEKLFDAMIARHQARCRS
jgi:predicted transcriptional regulator